MKSKQIIIDTPFNINFSNYFQPGLIEQNIFDSHFAETQTKEWINYRIRIFMKYTKNSFINQTNQNFISIIRYSTETKDLIFEALSKYPKLPDNIMFVTQDEANEIIEKAISEHDYLYHVNIDSDNMYDVNFINQIDEYIYEEGVECLLCHDGYIYDQPSNRLAKITHHSPSLYVYIYNKETYKQYFKERLFEPHKNAELHVNVGVEGRSYMLITHLANLDNDFNLIKGWLGDGTLVDGAEKEGILRDWNLI